QLKALSKVEKRVKKVKKRGVGVGLGLVGMVRQQGCNNLQGFATFRKGRYNAMFGYANDLADGGEGAEPFVRLQPKLNLDLDL
ncbi:unnamed protein product, partial [Phaeothamnion confervicola]